MKTLILRVLRKVHSTWCTILIVAGVLPVLASSELCAQVSISTDWSSNGPSANAAHYGLNLWSGMDPNTAQNTTYKSQITDINPGIIRLHGAEQLIAGNAKSWVDSSGTAWNATTVQTEVNNLTMGGDKMITIAYWPGVWQDNNGRLLSSHYADYANLCASLVQIVKNTGKYVKYWEPFNERDPSYSGDGAELGVIFKQCRTAMQNVDSTIQVGGPAWTQPWDDVDFDACLGQIGSNIDFVSYHQYGSYTSTTDIQSLYDGTVNFGGGANNVRNKMNAQGQSGKPLFLGEYNMFTDWTLDSASLMASDKSAVYDALALSSLIQSGKADWAASWNDADNTFGKLDPSYNKRPSAYFLRLARQALVGTSVNSTTSSSSAVSSLAIKNGSNQSLLLICRSNTGQTVNLSFNSGWAPGNNTYTIYNISSAGYSTTTGTWTGTPPQGIYMPANSLTLYQFTAPGGAGTVVSTGGTATASSQPVAAEASSNAFDQNSSTKWLGSMTASGAWLQYQFGNGVANIVTSYQIVSANDDYGRHPRNWTINGSNDGVNWSAALDTETGQSYVTAGNAVKYSFSNTTAYKYYRMNISVNNGSTEGGTGLVQLADWTLIGTSGSTTIVSTGGTATASSQPVSAEVSAYAFDQNSSTKWLGNMTNSGAWLQYQFGNGVANVVTSYQVVSASDDYGRHPRSWTITGSNDGVNWSAALDTQSGQAYVTAGNTVKYSFPNTIAYKYYRMNILSNNGSTETNLGGTGLVQLADWNLIGSNSSGTLVSIGGSATASSQPVAAEISANAFDQNSSTKWLGNMTASGAWLQYQFGSGAAYVATSYQVVSASDDYGRHPRNWTITGSNDGVNWSAALDTQTGQAYVSAGNTVKYSFSNTSAYKYYRMNISANNGSTETNLGGTGLVQLADWNLYQ